MLRAPLATAAFALLAGAGGCGQTTIHLLPGDDLARSPIGDGDVENERDLAGLDAGPDLARLPGPIHLGDDASAERCAASLASASLRQALCTCSALEPRGGIATSAIDSSGGNVDADRTASVASNRGLEIGGPFNIGGALVAVDALSSTSFLGFSSVRQSLRAEASVSLVTRLVVGGDAWIGGPIAGPLEVYGRYHLVPGAPPPPGHDHEGADGGADDDVRYDYQPLAWPPCDCDTGRVPVGALVGMRSLANDNAAAGLHPGDLAGIAVPTTIELPAGRFYVSSIATTADLNLAVHGPAALFVDGSIKLGGALAVRLDPAASLDLVFSGDLEASAGRVGSADAPEQPARVRLWSSSSSLRFPAPTTVSAAIHAPSAELRAQSGLNLHGAALVDRVTLDGPTLAISFDRALLSIGHATCGTDIATPIQ